MDVVIADDEPLAREWLRMLVKEIDDASIVGEARDGAEAVALANELVPDLIFLDIEMPMLNGLQVVEQLVHTPAVIFTTAFDHYAAAAFDVHALDYLQKPFDRERFRRAVRRARESIAPYRSSLVERARSAVGGDRHRSRIFVRVGARIVPIEVDDIVHLSARRDCVAVFTHDREHVLATNLGSMLEQLDPAHFLRVHRSHAVNIRHVVEIQPLSNGRMLLELPGGLTVPVSRSYTPDLRRLVY